MKIDSKTQESHARAAVFVLAVIGMSIAIAWGLLSAKQGRPITTFFSLLIGWGGYLLAHYTETGRAIDPRQNEPALPLERDEVILAGIGVITLLAGIGTAALGISSTNLPITSTGIVALMAGYLLAHYAMTDLLL